MLFNPSDYRAQSRLLQGISRLDHDTFKAADDCTLWREVSKIVVVVSLVCTLACIYFGHDVVIPATSFIVSTGLFLFHRHWAKSLEPMANEMLKNLKEKNNLAGQQLPSLVDLSDTVDASCS